MLTLIVIVFVLGYLAIALEHPLGINKAASALFIGILCWTLYAIDAQNLVPAEAIPAWFMEELPAEEASKAKSLFLVEQQLLHLTGEIAGILFFLMGAMTIVELVDANEGFSVITRRIKAESASTLLLIVAVMTFFFSAILDNLTTTIVMISLLRKLVHDREQRLFFAGMVVIAANAGGAWTVIGDVTTTMLWIKHKITTVEVMKQLFVPSAVCCAIPAIMMARKLKGPLPPAPVQTSSHGIAISLRHQILFLVLGVSGLISVPIFKAITHLPPFMGMTLALGTIWIISEIFSRTLEPAVRSSTGVLAALLKVDMSSILFFLGILLAVGSLAATGLLGELAEWLDATVGSPSLIAFFIGLASAVVDNVPLVAAGIEMYPVSKYGVDNSFWMELAYCAGTGGSCLIIGSAAGVAAMGLEQINFVWYLKKIAPFAFAGYVAGFLIYLAQISLF
jgi:Na+/H+ antiporter NhaD/arsenite permease-like protein